MINTSSGNPFKLKGDDAVLEAVEGVSFAVIAPCASFSARFSEADMNVFDRDTVALCFFVLPVFFLPCLGSS